MFGCKSNVVKNIADKINAFSKTNWYHCDQEFLKNIIYPEIKNNVLVHDDWNATPFPTQRKNYEFVGQVFDDQEQTIEEHVNVLKKHINEVF